MRVLDLFSGIGGFSLGLERAGMRTVAFCEIDPYCRAVLRKHWPTVPCFDDVRNLHAFDVGPVDVIAGGFPCQDISTAGKGAGLAGARSGLWSEYRRLIEECRPRYAIIENVSALRSRGLDQVLGELAAIGYDAEWHCIPASAVGAPHQRDRIWIVAYPGGEGRREILRGAHGDEGPDAWWPEENLHLACGDGAQRDVADPYIDARLARGLGNAIESARRRNTCGGGISEDVADSNGQRGCDRHAEREDATDARQSPGCAEYGIWHAEPDVGRVANGIPSRVDRLRSLGNAVVPEIPEIIGQAIVNFEQRSATYRSAK